MSDEPVKICPLCGEKVRRLISGGTGLIFKGSGYYLTDYVKKEKSNKTQTSKEKSTKVKKDSKPTNSEGTK
jgi:predicted nucleic acid-binding Zn ribbon protein